MPCEPYSLLLLLLLVLLLPSQQPFFLSSYSHPSIHPSPIPYPVGAVIRPVHCHSPLLVNMRQATIIRGHSLARCFASVYARPGSIPGGVTCDDAADDDDERENVIWVC